MQAARHIAAHLRQQVEQDLAHRIPSALSPRERLVRERLSVGIDALDDLLDGGVPVGALTELVGPEGSGRTSFAMALLTSAMAAGGVCAWVDVADVLDPLSAAVSGVDLERLLWVRCGLGGVDPESCHRSTPEADSEKAALPKLDPRDASSSGSAVRPLQNHGSPHPRSEARGMSEAVGALLQGQPRSSAVPLRRRDKSIGTPSAPNRALPSRSLDREEQIATDRLPPRRGEQLAKTRSAAERRMAPRAQSKPTQAQLNAQTGFGSVKRGWAVLDQALRATDLLLQSGGFGLLVLDLGSTPPEMSWRIPLATWFRFRAACERSRTSLLILTQHPCARSSAELVLRLGTGRLEVQGAVLTGITYRAVMERRRFEQVANKVVSIRKPMQREAPGEWKGQAAWAIQA